MAAPIQQPWAILLCRFNNDLNDPATTKISDLYSEWLAQSGSEWISNNLSAASASDNRTILEVYNNFFTTQGQAGFNAVRYWSEMSHGSIDVSGSKVFPCILDISKEDALDLATNPGGAAYQNEMFQKAKAYLDQQYHEDWKKYYAVAVSFQSPDFGAQGGWYDGGPGVFMDIRYVIGNGIQAWGQEMGHAFGLDHSRTDGSTDDYTDPWDIMSTRAAFSGADPLYGMRGPGLNAWNMRSRKWLDESRVWKATTGNDFSETIILRPLHKKNLPGYLAIELPAVGNNSPYLAELRVQNDWDNGIPNACVLVHRFSGNEENNEFYYPNLVGKFLGTHSYTMMGTNGQLSLSQGDIFEKGSGPFSRIRVLSIDAVNEMATVQVCHAAIKLSPSVKISFASSMDPCAMGAVEGGNANFVFKVSNVQCQHSYKILWSVSGTTPIPLQPNDQPKFSVLVPDPSTTVTVSVTLMLEDGTVLKDSKKFHGVSQQQAQFMELVCNILHERLKPHPWWTFNPVMVRTIAERYSPKELHTVETGLQEILQTVKRLREGVHVEKISLLQ